MRDLLKNEESRKQVENFLRLNGCAESTDVMPTNA